MSNDKTKRQTVCKYNPIGVLCYRSDINEGKCSTCGWNPDEYEKRVIELKTKYGKKG